MKLVQVEPSSFIPRQLKLIQTQLDYHRILLNRRRVAKANAVEARNYTRGSVPICCIDGEKLIPEFSMVTSERPTE